MALAVRKGSRVTVKTVSTLLASRSSGKVQMRSMIDGILEETTPRVVYETHLILVDNPLKSTGQQDEAISSVVRRTEVVGRRACTREPGSRP